jgi:hypothetical protein
VAQGIVGCKKFDHAFFVEVDPTVGHSNSYAFFYIFSKWASHGLIEFKCHEIQEAMLRKFATFV